MKKIVASVGLVALGASGLQAASVPGLTTESGKPFSVSATLRGFYDDNINSAPNAADLGGKHRDSFGYEVSPSVVFSWPLEQTSVSLAYTYSYKYFENKLAFSDGHDIQSHTVNLSLDHAFSERYQVNLKDSFVIGQEPDILRTGNALTTFQSVPGDNIRNYGAINFDGQATRLLGYEIGYANSFYDYENTGEFENGLFVGPTIGGLLNRMEHMVHLDSRWQLQPQTVGIIGYQFREVDYLADEVIGFQGITGDPVFSDVRNSRIHYGYVGADHTFRPDLTGSIRVGAQYADYYNDPGTDASVSPYALASMRWTYLPESYVELGVTHDRNATDVLGIEANEVTVDQESTVVYGSINHRITPKLFGSVLGQFQYSEFNGGLFGNQAEKYYMVGVNLEYRFNPHFSAHVGYNYDKLESDLGSLRDLDRNRVYIGLTARY